MVLARGTLMTSRYSRQIIIPEIGDGGQERLSSAKVAVVGAGGLGSPVLYYLASAGVGHIRIIDSDVLDITNLNRQCIHSESDVGREKSRSAMEALQRYNHDIQVYATTAVLDDDNALEHLTGFDVVLSCVDNKTARYVLNKACVSARVPLIDGGVQDFSGYVLTVLPGVTPCYQCIFPQKNQSQDTGSFGILGAVAGVLGSMIAMEAIKLIVSIQMILYLRYVDLMSCEIASIAANKAPGCPVCGCEI